MEDSFAETIPKKGPVVIATGPFLRIAVRWELCHFRRSGLRAGSFAIAHSYAADHLVFVAVVVKFHGCAEQDLLGEASEFFFDALKFVAFCGCLGFGFVVSC